MDIGLIAPDGNSVEAVDHRSAEYLPAASKKLTEQLADGFKGTGVGFILILTRQDGQTQMTSSCHRDVQKRVLKGALAKVRGG